ncbi:MAG TPA: ion channel [Terriglobales bacterium]|nr:ion channel [Dongiaceae bacterium]HVO64719.1 ion channel [Terriglobales bacterium]
MMIFFHQNGTTVVLVTLTILLQCAGMAALIQWIKAQFPNGIHQLGLFRSFLLVVRFTSLLVCLHMSEILLWAWFYRWKFFATLEAAFYFSAANYSTVGAADLLLQPTWRIMGPVESVTGVLMCGLSASFLFAIVTRLIALQDPGLAEPHASGPDYASDTASEQTALRRRETANIRDAVVARAAGR